MSALLSFSLHLFSIARTSSAGKNGEKFHYNVESWWRLRTNAKNTEEEEEGEKKKLSKEEHSWQYVRRLEIDGKCWLVTYMYTHSKIKHRIYFKVITTKNLRRFFFFFFFYFVLFRISNMALPTVEYAILKVSFAIRETRREAKKHTQQLLRMMERNEKKTHTHNWNED